MRINVYHVGRTGKESQVTFDTETKQYYLGFVSFNGHDMAIYVDQTRDVRSAIAKLNWLGFTEVSEDEFKPYEYKRLTREVMI